jgi:hypothetical protein
MLLPEARFIHIIRDGRDVALSLRQTWFSPGPDMATLAADWCEWVTAIRAEGAGVRHYREVRYEDLVNDPEGVLRTIAAHVDLPFDPAMIRYHERVPERLIEHRERIAADGRVVVSREQRLRQQAMTMRPPAPSRAFAWRRDMMEADRAVFETVAGPLLDELGYPRDPSEGSF